MKGRPFQPGDEVLFKHQTIEDGVLLMTVLAHPEIDQDQYVKVTWCDPKLDRHHYAFVRPYELQLISLKVLVPRTIIDRICI